MQTSQVVQMRNDGNLDNGWSDGGRREGQKYIQYIQETN